VIKAVFYLAGALSLASILHAETKAAGNEKEIHRLIGELGAQEYAAREAAQKQLLQIGDQNYEAVLDLSVHTYAATKDPEVKDRLRSVMANLVGTKIFGRPRGYLGVQITPAAAVNGQAELVGGIAVVKAMEDGVATKAGIQAGDTILQIDDLDLVQTPSAAEFINRVQSKQPGEKVQLIIKHGENVTTNDLVLGELPKEIQSDLYGDEARKQFFKNWLGDKLKALTPKAGS
jgi:C-terminal processing protease CtpA/Prc